MRDLPAGAATMTVLFTDLVDSTATRTRIGDDRADALRREHDELLGKVIGEHRGQVVKGLGDGIMAVFHAPSEAVAAASAINQAIVRRNRKAPEPVVLRMGMSVGEVRVEDDDVFGTPVVEAARLCGKAANEQILVSDYVRALAGSRSSAAYEEVGLLDLKGLSEPLRAFEVQWWEVAESGRLAFPSVPGLSRSIPFIGRQHELLGLAEAWARAGLGKGPLVVVDGPPGSGASRLAVEFAMAQHLDDATVLYGRCDPFGASPFDPFVEALRGHTVQVADDQLREQLGPEASELVRVVPELAGRLPRVTGAPAPDAQVQTTALFEAFAGWLGALSAIEPVVFVLDDLQWASRSTLALLRHVLLRTDPMRVLVIATRSIAAGDAPDPAITEALDELRDGPRGVERIDLRSPPPDDLTTMVVDAAGGAVTETEARVLADAVAATGGAVLDALWSPRVGAGAVPPGGASSGAFVRAGVAAILRGLDAPTAELVRMASAMGDEIDPAVLAPLVGSEPDAVARLLAGGPAAPLVTELGDGQFRLTFTHASVRAAIYATLDPSKRSQVHQQLADELERQAGPGNPRVWTIVAHHRAAATGASDNDHPAGMRSGGSASGQGEGGDATMIGTLPTAADQVRAAAEALAAAGHAAREQLALDDAAGWYAEAMQSLDGVPEPDPGLLAEVVLALGEAQHLIGAPEARATLLRAAQLARASGDVEGLARAALASRRDTIGGLGTVDEAETDILLTALDGTGSDDSPTRARLLVSLAVELASAGSADAAARATEAVEMAARLGDDVLLAHVLEHAVVAVTGLDDFALRLVWTERLADLAPGVTDPDRTFGIAFVRSTVALEVGDLPTVQRCLVVARDAAARRRHPMLSWHLSIRESADAYVRGDLDRAQRFAEGALELGQRARRPETLASFRPLLVAIRRQQGRLTELVPRLEQVFAGDPAADAFGVARALADAGRLDLASVAYGQATAAGFADRRGPNLLAELCNLAELAALLGDQEGAAALAERLQPVADRHAVFVVPLPVVAKALAMLAATRGDVAGAHALFDQAVRHHDEKGMPLLAAETRMEWARYCQAVRATDIARQLADQCLTLAAHHRAHGLDAQARAFLSTLPAAASV